TIHAPRDAPTLSLARLPTAVCFVFPVRRRRRLGEEKILGNETGCLDQRVDLVDALLAFGLVYALLSAHDDTRPRSRPQFSRVRIAVSRPSATALSAPASRSAASAASCASLVRPPGALSSNAKQRPLWIAMISGVPATTPRPCRILASIGLRKPPFA